ncbi:MAG: hypothetical protein ACLRMZ_05495 [Blautia marasmi]
MKMKSFKSKILLAGVIFMLAGAAVGLVGFGMTGFEPNNLLKWSENRWYQTIHYQQGNFHIGIKLREESISPALALFNGCEHQFSMFL